MQLKIAFAMIAGLSLNLTACTGRSSQPIQVSPPSPQQSGGGNQGGQQGNQSGESSSGQKTDGEESSSMTMRVEEKQLQSYSIDTSNLTYYFTYSASSYSKKDRLTFNGGVAIINLTGLPIGKTGDMVLELRANDLVTARGVASNVTLKAGNNDAVEIKLTPVAGNQDSVSTTNVQINVKLDSTPTTPVTPTPAPTPPAPTPPAPTPPPPTTPVTPTTTTPAPTPTTDPLSNWDGTSFLGNGKWQIKPVQ